MHRLFIAGVLATIPFAATGGAVHAQTPPCTVTEVVIPISANGGTFESTSVPTIFLELTAASGVGPKSIDFSIDQSQGPAGILQVFVDWKSIDEDDVIVDMVVESFNFGGSGVTNNTFGLDDATFDSWGANARFQVCTELAATTTAVAVTSTTATTPTSSIAPTQVPTVPTVAPAAPTVAPAAPTVAPASTLPATGIESTIGWWVAVAALSIGLLLVRVARRRTPNFDR